MTAAAGGLLLISGIIVVALIALLRPLATDEIRAWLPHLTRWLIQGAARRLPEIERDRYEEEWLAEVAAWADRPLSAAAKAAHIRWRVREMNASLRGHRVGGIRSKRAIDLAFAAFFLAYLLPVLVLIAVAIRTSSRGPVFFRQVRVGRGGQTFAILKFRTMVIEPRDGGDALRVTPIGRLLRRTAMDELPQLINVLRGEMSLVGPRPRTPHNPNRESPLVLSVAPGLTGPAQLAAYREGYPGSDRYDVDYVQTRSLARDLELLLQTVAALLRGRPPLG